MLRHSGAQRWRRRHRDTERFGQTRYSETDVKPRRARGDGGANASCPVALPVSRGSQNKTSGKIQVEKNQPRGAVRAEGWTHPDPGIPAGILKEVTADCPD